MTEIIEADTIVPAIGQAVDLSLVPQGLETTKSGTIRVDPVAGETSLLGVFAGGDVVSGPASVVEALAAGKEAAISIDRYLKGEDLRVGRYSRPKRVRKHPGEGMERLARIPTPVLPVGPELLLEWLAQCMLSHYCPIHLLVNMY